MKTFLLSLLAAIAFGSVGCISKKTTSKVPVLLTVEDAQKSELTAQVNRLAEVKSISGKVYVKFEDNTFAESGIADKYKTANGQVIVQSPASINLKIQVPFVGSDLVVMTSDGDKFRVAIPCCVDKKYQKFVFGTNDADYTQLRNTAKKNMGDGSEEKRAIGAFSSLRPQHFTDALLMRPLQTGDGFTSTQSEIYQEEADPNGKSAASRVVRGYYLLDELKRVGDKDFQVSRRFWFDRVGAIRLARQQVFGENGNLVADIAYGAETKFGENGQFSFPSQVQVTRPQERYSVKLTFQSPADVITGKQYEPPVFLLENRWQLPEVDLDKRTQ